MSSGEDSDDAFDSLPPQPPKRRRLNTRVLDEFDDEEEENISPSAVRRLNTRGKEKNKEKPATTKTPKSLPKQQRVHVPTGPPIVLEDQYLTQIPQRIPSSPYRIRGAIWQKPKQENAAVVSVCPDSIHTHTEGIDSFDDDIEAEEALRALDAPNKEIETAKATKAVEREIIQPTVPPTNSMEAATGYNFEEELADLPSDAFDMSSSPEKSPSRVEQETILISSQVEASPTKRPNLAGPQKGLRQMTLFGDAAQNVPPASQAAKRHNWPVANKSEPPTHHALNPDALKTWIYPTNLGTIREYQFNIVARGLYHNLLVALPTGLGKTFIAATVMLNWYRWTKDAQIVFVAPTKPLVSQQVEACFGIAGIPRSQTTMLTGGISPGLRAEEWASKRVFFMTPQTIINDLKTGICDPKKIVLLVVDEAHRATGAYAYVEVVKFIRRFNQSFRVLALTATPGASVETVQEVIDGLDISRVEIRTEFSLDIRQYVHARRTESVVFDNSEEMELIMDLFSKALQPVLNKLNQFNAYWSKDPMQLSAFGLTQARQRWMASPAGKNANFAIKGMVNRIFTVLASLAHSIELLKFHGIGPFYHGMVTFRNSQDTAKGKYEKEIAESDAFRKMMTTLQFWINNPTFIGHPKLDYLQGLVLKHFVDAGDGHGVTAGAPPSATRIMIFAHYRDSAEEIVRTLKRNEPMVRPHVFVGQAASKGSEGMDQKKQLGIIKEFKDGKYNTLVATSIGEEGLDIGEVDLIVCYDSSASPIRMLQRMGRTGRKRAGNIVLLLMRGKEENSFASAKDNYEKMQQMIAAGTRFDFHDDRSPRIVPRDVVPAVDKRVVEIPIENTQADLPEPKKRAGRAPKRPPKKFHMPDGVRTGFVKASRMEASDDEEDDVETISTNGITSHTRKVPGVILEPIPALEDVLLNATQERELEMKYQNVPEGYDSAIAPPRLNQYPNQQRKLGLTGRIGHSRNTLRTVKMLQAMHKVDNHRISLLERTSKSPNHELLEGQDRLLTMEEYEDMINLPPPKVVTKRAPKAKVSKLRIKKTEPKKPAAKKPKKPAAQNSRQSKAAKTTKLASRRPLAFDAVDEALGSSPPPTSPRIFMPSQGISLGGSDTSGEDEDEFPDSELQDFIVATDEEVEQPPTSSVSVRIVQSSKNDELEMMMEDDDEDCDLPDDPLMVPTGTVGWGGNAKKATTSTTKRKRRVVEDSSD